MSTGTSGGNPSLIRTGSGDEHKERSPMADDDAPDGAPPAGNTGTTRLPDDHPLVLAHNRLKSELSDTRVKLKEHEDADKTELQKLQDGIAERDKQLADLPKSVRSQAIRFASLAGAQGFIDPEDALLGIGDVDIADEEKVKQALSDLAERKPHLVRAEKPKPKTRPKPKDGDTADDTDDGLEGKERAAAALRAIRSTR